MKGQSQKVQQAVLKVGILFGTICMLLPFADMVHLHQQKFRSGAFNVIVATSIGEEGLDIMEVDLVISFDANISPLRMIQRMGRTGRKHDGRVDILWLSFLFVSWQLLLLRKKNILLFSTNGYLEFQQF